MSWLDSLFQNPSEPQNLPSSEEQIISGLIQGDFPSGLLNDGMMGAMGAIMNSPSLPKLMDLLTGAMSNMSGDKLPNDEFFIKEFTKAIYGLTGEMMGLSPEEELEFLRQTKSAIEELIVVKAQPMLTVIYLDGPENNDAKSGDSGAGGNSTGN